MGDKKPSEFYRYLKNLAGVSNAVSNDLIRNLWQTRLPKLINIALIPQKDLAIENVLLCADQVWEALQESHISAISDPSTNVQSVHAPTNATSSYSNLEKEVNELKDLFKKMNSSHNPRESRPRSRSRDGRNRSQSGNRKSFNKLGKLCWYHFKFADRASKCIKPCQWNNSAAHSAQSKN